MTGFVSIVGAGPGAADLLTLRAVDRLRQADAVVVDRLVHPDTLAYCRPGVSRYVVGKSPGGCGTAQEDINELLVALANEGQRVVRLKGGDPFVFGRGGEEALALASAGVAHEVVPGLSAALAAPAAAGIPVTHRGVAQSFTVATATGAGGAALDEVELRALAKGGGTLVLLMVMHRLECIVADLIRFGRSCAEPAAIVSHGTWECQMVIKAPLAEIAQHARSARVVPPAVLVVGPTVALGDEIAR